MAGKHLLLLLATTLLFSFAAAADRLETKVTKFQFYMHDILDGPNATVAQVVTGRPANSSSSSPIPISFGSVYVMDDPLTVSPDPKSEWIGQVQGVLVTTSLGNDFSLTTTATYSFMSGPYNGSSFTVLGRNPILKEVREVPIVGGTGIFRLSRGYLLARTLSSVGNDSTVGYNATVLHY
ncbi:dirigent protein 1-like [Aristolochia californica]|uniref:dirigent protein 1-like n=1 Tax=Aristolochia californica TaxID=171875 RepID=UPI0035DCF1D1